MKSRNNWLIIRIIRDYFFVEPKNLHYYQFSINDFFFFVKWRLQHPQCGKVVRNTLSLFTENLWFFPSNQRFYLKKLRTKELISRKFLSVIAFYSTFPHTLWKLRNFTAKGFSQNFRQIIILQKNFTTNWFDGKKFAWQWIFYFSTMCHSALWHLYI